MWRFIFLIMLFTFVLSSKSQNSFVLVGDAYNQYIHILDLLQDDLSTQSQSVVTKHQHTTFGLLDSTNSLTYHTNGCYFFENGSNRINDRSIHHGSNIEKYCENYGSLSNDNAIILPSVEDKNKMILLYTRAYFNQSTNTIQKTDFSFSMLDTETNSIQHEQTIYTGNITPLSHLIKKDGSGYWILFCDIDKKLIYLYSLSSDNITLHKKIPFPINSDYCMYDVNIKFSALGTKIGMHHSSCYFGLYDFDNCSGNIVGPRINLFAGDSDVFGIDFAFTQDDKYIVLGQEKVNNNNNNTSHSILIFETSSIGVNINPRTILNTPYNFSLGKIFTTDSKVVVFNRFEDSYFLDIQIRDKEIKLDTINFRRLPFRYTPSFSKLLNQQIEMTNDCISATTDHTTDNRFTLFPNPVTNNLYLKNLKNTNSHAFILEIIDISGKHIASFIYQTGESIDVSHLAEGSYLLIIFDIEGNEQSFQTLKFIKQ